MAKKGSITDFGQIMEIKECEKDSSKCFKKYGDKLFKVKNGVAIRGKINVQSAWNSNETYEASVIIPEGTKVDLQPNMQCRVEKVFVEKITGNRDVYYGYNKFLRFYYQGIYDIGPYDIYTSKLNKDMYFKEGHYFKSKPIQENNNNGMILDWKKSNL